MHRFALLASCLLCACSASGVAGGRGGAGGAGGTGGGGGGTGCEPPVEIPVVFLADDVRDLSLAGVVVEHRDLAPGERPDGAGPATRLLAIDGGAGRATVFYRVPGAAVEPPVRPGDRVRLDFRRYAPAGESAGATLRTEDGRLLWAVEAGGFGTLETGAPDLLLEPGEPVCTWDDCGTWSRRRVVASLDGGAAVEVAPGGSVSLSAGDREGRLALAEWAENRPSCPETPALVTGFALAASPPAACDGTCPPGFYCDFPVDDCGASGPGRCVGAPGDCAGNGLVCGCDGQLHWSPCAAWQAGVDLDSRGTCEVPDDAFACGPWFCGAFTDVCWVFRGDGGTTRYSCEPAPDACAGSASCDCLALPTDIVCSCSAAGPEVTVSCEP